MAAPQVSRRGRLWSTRHSSDHTAIGLQVTSVSRPEIEETTFESIA
ncbi:hypothetical protein ACFYWY_08440 [Streptomyces sp. NPDC002870]